MIIIDHLVNQEVSRESDILTTININDIMRIDPHPSTEMHQKEREVEAGNSQPVAIPPMTMTKIRDRGTGM